jgi:predicted acetyltransferase
MASAPPLAPLTPFAPSRPATEADIPALAALWALAFPGGPGVEARTRTLREGGSWGGLEQVWLLESEGRLDAALRAIPLEIHLWGRPTPMLGLAAVAVAPHARRRGLATRLCREALLRGRAGGTLVAGLFPFRAGFYRQLGFALTGEFHRYRFAPEALPALPGAHRVEPIPDPALELPPLYAARLSRGHGLLTRRPPRWEAILGSHPLAFGIRGPEGGGWRGYLLGRVQSGPNGVASFRILEAMADDPESYRALMGWLSLQRDAWRQIIWDALPGEGLQHLLDHPRLPVGGRARKLWFPSATLLRGPMMRILNVPDLLRHVGAPAGATLAVEDHDLQDNTGRWRVEPGGEVRREDDAPLQTLPMGLATALLLEGRLAGVTPDLAGFDPLLGNPEFRIFDTF